MGWAVKAVFDTNILVDFLNGIGGAGVELARYKTRRNSSAGYMEVLVPYRFWKPGQPARRFSSQALPTSQAIGMTETMMMPRMTSFMFFWTTSSPPK